MSAAPVAAGRSKPTLLFVHGAWHGAWAWDRLASVLETRGWIVARVDLPSVHAPDPVGVHMGDDASVIEHAIAAVDGPVVVVAHSYGGVPTTQAGTGDNVRHIIYIAAIVLDRGESVLGFTGGVAPTWWSYEGDLVTAGTATETPESLLFPDVDTGIAAEAVDRLRPQSAVTFEDPLTQVAWRTKPSTYIITTQDAVAPPEAQEALARRAGSTIRRIEASHSPFLSRPDALADLIEQAAAP